MAKHKFEDFLVGVPDEYKGFVTTVHELLQGDYKGRIQTTKNGLSLSYAMPKTQRILGFSFRDSDLMVHINAENHAKYPDVLHSLPQVIVSQIDEASYCKKFDDLQKCWSTCEPGYDFYIGEKHFQKCRYYCFKLKVDAESIPFLLEIIKSEHKERANV